MSIENKYLLKIKSAFLQAVNSGKPEKIFSEKIKNYFPNSKEIKVLAVGKAASSMVEQIIKLKIASTGVLVTNAENFRYIKGFECFSTGHPLPDKKGLNASNKVELFLDKLDDSHHLLILLSGGGSSLLPAPAHGLSLKEKIYINERLLESGIDIKEINAVRRLFSRLKGGRLLKRAYPAKVSQLIFSDVMDDSLETIASGIAAPDPYDLKDVKKILKKTNLLKEPFVLNYIKKIERNSDFLPLKSSDKIFKNVKNYILANNKTCLDKAIQIMEEELTFKKPIGIKLEGEASSMGVTLAKWLISQVNEAPFFTALGGETTVTLKEQNSGKGGRCQELALSFALYMKKNFNKRKWIILAAGTDGRDGPTNAAGAIITSDKKINIFEGQEYLKKNDSYNFLIRNKLLLNTGGTDTNLGDLVIMVMF